jgi:RNA polymerase sigma factor (sigma-70 family)
MSDETALKKTLLGDPRLRQELVVAIRRRVPPDAVDDVVQATLVDAFASDHAPATLDEFRRWLWGIARNKAADHHRKRRRERGDEVPEIEAPADGTREANDLLRWAERELPEGPQARQTLGWLLREGEGEKLEHIAAEENLPAPRVRQRVTRLRQHFRARWQAQFAAVAVVLGTTAALWWWLRPRPAPEAPIVRETPPPLPSASLSAPPLSSAAPVPSLSAPPRRPAPLSTTPTTTPKKPSPVKTPVKDSAFEPKPVATSLSK